MFGRIARLWTRRYVGSSVLHRSGGGSNRPGSRHHDGGCLARLLLCCGRRCYQSLRLSRLVRRFNPLLRGEAAGDAVGAQQQPSPGTYNSTDEVSADVRRGQFSHNP